VRAPRRARRGTMTRARGTIAPRPRRVATGLTRRATTIHYEEPPPTMTSRPRQGTSRTRTWEDPARRNMLMNLGFGLAIAAALLTLIIAGAVGWYTGHLAPAIKVNDITLTQDDVQRQAKVNAFLIDYQRKRTRTLLSAGHLWATDANARIQTLNSQATDVVSVSVNQLTDGTIMVDLASKNGQAVTQDDIAAKQTEAATQPELRHVWQIVVAPTLASGETTATDAEKAAAKAKADQALADLKGGGDWETIAKSTSTDTATAPQGGDVGFIDKNSSLDTAFVDALMAAPLNTPTDVIEGSDGSYYIGRVTETIPPDTDATFAQQAQDAGLSQADLDWSFKYSAANTKLNDWVVSQAMAPAPQRHVYRIFMQYSASESGPSAIRVRHILFSPNHDPNAAPTLAATDPAWDAAKALADAAYAKLQADPTQFDALARSESDESAAKTSGGKLPYFSTDDSIDADFAAAIFKPGLQPGQLLAPVKSQYGWHVIQVMHGPTDLEWANKLIPQATSLDVFKTLARDNSDDAEAAQGGDMGWIGQHTYQVSDQVAAAIFAAPVGKVSQVLQVDSDGTYIFWVAEEQTRAPDGAQADSIKANAFTSWYTPLRATYTIWQDPALTPSATS
jgi:parvulin-like peptidyl-prolyl isomerase